MIKFPSLMTILRLRGESGRSHGKRGRSSRHETSRTAAAELRVDEARFTPAQRTHWFWLGVFFVAAAVLAARILSLGMAEFYVQVGNENAVARALDWNAAYPAALTGQGSLLADTDAAQATVLLTQAIRGNPADASAYLSLAKASGPKNAERAGKLVSLAVDLAPRREDIQLGAAEFWLSQGRPDIALSHWSEALHVRPELGEKLFPVMLQMAQNPLMWPAFSGAYANGQRWWASFFRFVATYGENTEALRALYYIREKTGAVMEAEERQALIARLQRDGRWLDAYFAWLNSLGPQQLGMLGHVYNGSFEVPIGNEGFDWHAPSLPGVVVEAVPTVGATGAKALHVVFQGGRARFQHVYQYLLLDPGRYRFQGRVRMENLDTEKGLQWALRCATDNRLLAISEYFLGTDQWRHFGMEFAIPSEGCKAQLLRLELAGQLEFELQAKGAAWFDDLTIILLEDARISSMLNKSTVISQ